MKRIVIAVACVGMLAGCGMFDKDKKVTPTVGQRISVLSSEAAIEVDPALAGIPVNLPAPAANAWST